ncbi:MAG: aldose 1-epimerase family protein [Oscillospiraceae bacterium]|nr:aldose 1-epimerase family protein [Oscillospiraceae bacterium]
MDIFNQEYSREDILRRCNPSALFGARRVELTDGRGAGHKLIEVKTTAGLRASFIESRCLDILDLEYRGVNLGFLSKNGMIESPIANPEINSFTKYCAGGFLFTCGLRNTGGNCEVDGEFFPIHGHIGLTPAESASIDVNDKEIVITGKVRETALFGHCLEMERKITIPSDGAKITVRDTVHNLTPEAEHVLLLYHINFGFPFLSEDLELKFPKGEVKGRTELAQSAISEHAKITPPIDEEPEVVYFHSPEEKDVSVNLSNARLGVEAIINYDASELPVLAQWKCMRSGDYALGIEPGTSFIRGRKEELENGYDIAVPPFGKLEFGFTVEFNNLKGDIE